MTIRNMQAHCDAVKVRNRILWLFRRTPQSEPRLTVARIRELLSPDPPAVITVRRHLEFLRRYGMIPPGR